MQTHLALGPALLRRRGLAAGHFAVRPHRSGRFPDVDDRSLVHRRFIERAQGTAAVRRSIFRRRRAGEPGDRRGVPALRGARARFHYDDGCVLAVDGVVRRVGAPLRPPAAAVLAFPDRPSGALSGPHPPRVVQAIASLARQTGRRSRRLSVAVIVGFFGAAPGRTAAAADVLRQRTRPLQGASAATAVRGDRGRRPALEEIRQLIRAP